MQKQLLCMWYNRMLISTPKSFRNQSIPACVEQAISVVMIDRFVALALTHSWSPWARVERPQLRNKYINVPRCVYGRPCVQLGIDGDYMA